jgi:hypothetical protein
MRKRTISSTNVRLAKCGIGLALALPLLLSSTDASALGSCDETALDCAVGTAAMKYESRNTLPTTIETPWIPSSGMVQVKALVNVDPVTNGGPLYTMDMSRGAVLEASWPDKGMLSLKAVTGAQSDGTIKVHHTLTPDVQVHVKLGGFDETYTFNADSLLKKIPGSHFNFESQGQSSFAPWGFAGGTVQVQGPSIQNSLLFSMGFDALPDIVANNVAGSFGISATTNPSFTYKTSKVLLSGADTSILNDKDAAKVPAQDADFQEIYAQVEGELTVGGELDLVPSATVTRIGTTNVNTTLDYAVVKQPYTTPAQKIIFPSQLVHIPLPNVHMPEKAVDVGDAKVGQESSGKATIENSGELGAKLTATSSDPQFTVDAKEVRIGSKQTTDLTINFKPTSSGPATAKITIKSNDPDSPTQTFKVVANGADGSSVSHNAGMDDAPVGDASGCGCKTAGAPVGSNAGLGGFGGLLLALGLIARRRRA